jgi:hypothetical protein
LREKYEALYKSTIKPNLRSLEDKARYSYYQSVQQFSEEMKEMVDAQKLHLKKVEPSYLMKFQCEVDDFCNRMLLCGACVINYQYGSKSFLLACPEQPHLLVWAKQDTFPHWPAKVLKYHRESNCFEVLFFDSSRRTGLVPIDNCLRITEDYFDIFPKKHKKYQKALRASLNELNAHIANLRERFPNQVQYADGKVACDPNDVLMCDPNYDHMTCGDGVKSNAIDNVNGMSSSCQAPRESNESEEEKVTRAFKKPPTAITQPTNQSNIFNSAYDSKFPIIILNRCDALDDQVADSSPQGPKMRTE